MEVSPGHSNIHFNNLIQENDSINPIDVTNIYNGGGVAIGDFNNDGLQDIYFSGNLVSNKLYVNQGNLKFEDVTKKANVTGEGRWCRGVATIDINNDGLLDMYVCVSMEKDPSKRQNILYINKGIDKDGVPHFTDMAEAYGLNDTTHSTMASFFDYDNDGDLDMYLVVNEILKNDNPGSFRPIITDGSHPSTGRLYRNDWDPNLKHPVFTNVSKQAGITIEGYGHSVNIADFNKDGWKDIFVTNDFNSSDILYINNHDGTFSDKASVYFKHTSANGMGQDVIDINNDGLSDVVELDMNPQDNLRKKMMMSANSYQNYQNSDRYGYEYQYVRNTLQLNQGPRINQQDSIGDPVFSDIGFFAGIAETDWSWTPLVQDFDNDGLRDIVITNGFPRDVTDHDFIAFRQRSFKIASTEYTLSQVPMVKIHNYAYHNNGNTNFTDETSNWGLEKPTFSNGAACADLDNDGDMDMVINNIDDEALVYENTSMNRKENNNHYLAVKLVGDSLNRNGIGAWIELHYGGKQQVVEQTPYRGYLSSHQLEAHFGLGNIAKIDSVIVKWQNGTMQVLKNVAVDKTITINKKDAIEKFDWAQPVIAQHTFFTEISDAVNVHYQHKQNDFIDFNVQKLLPHKFSEYGPALACGDVNGDGLDDIVIGGSDKQATTLLLQQRNGSFLQNKLSDKADSTGTRSMDMGIVLFDADGDGDLDLFAASGGYADQAETYPYQDKFFINNGKGKFTADSMAIPRNFTSKSCVRVADYDNDGDLDLFIAGRVEPWKYPMPVSSFIYRNDSEKGVVKFTDVTSTVAKSLIKAGLICDAVWTDFDNDGWQDLILTGEWMPVTFLKNTRGIFTDVTSFSGVQNKKGWWTSIVPGDFDNDGKMDYIVGNLGLNSFYRATENYPVKIYAKDFDNNGSFDAVPTLFLPSSQLDTIKREFPAHTRDDMVKQMIMFRSKFQNYKSYATATIDSMFSKAELKNALILTADYFASSYLKNMGNGRFQLIPLPAQAQYSCINGMLVDDFNGDGNLDVLMNQNDYSTEVSVGRYDAGNGLLLTGDGKGDFFPVSILKSGWFIPGNGKALVKLKTASGKTIIAASQNKGKLKVFEWKSNQKVIALKPLDVSALITYKNGKKQKMETNYGASFLSQSARFLNIGDDVLSVQITDSRGKVYTANLQSL
ncbi:VCBS repeat-containing protein [Ferruginibacter paludis]|uniref:VCBS repeat-containing protein n=1 Tax=Ferruginibacter paludis TaxID=1310417 RepID=UPI0025B34D64|nr:VCBS repeat-containing protein [Ferruginibacter paludis]MDN3658024.1 VCBS repeat-containing protein [Ferruginibacter paludis]